jgi:hypothetical protein
MFEYSGIQASKPKREQFDDGHSSKPKPSRISRNTYAAAFVNLGARKSKLVRHFKNETITSSTPRGSVDNRFHKAAALLGPSLLVLDQSVRSLRANANLENRVQVKSIGKGGTAPVPQKGSFIVSQTPNSLTQTPVLGGPVEINETDQNGQNIPFFDVSRRPFLSGMADRKKKKKIIFSD